MDYDIIIENGYIVDGSGGPWFRGSVAIKDDSIVCVGDIPSIRADRVIDARNLIIAPGFIDIHSHADEHLIADNRAESILRQGITSICGGNCGYTGFPVTDLNIDFLQARVPPPAHITWTSAAGFYDVVQKHGVAINLGMMVGHGAIRSAAMGFAEREPTDSEMEKMKMLLSDAMDDGVYGLSSGLEYPPGFFADTEELIQLSKVAGEKGGFYSSHTRCGQLNYVGAVEEIIRIGREAEIPVQNSHIESHYPDWGKTPEVLELLDAARDDGIDITCDIPPYLYGMTTLSTIIPKQFHDGGIEHLRRRLKDPAIRSQIRDSITSMAAEDTEVVTMAMAVDEMWEDIRVSGKSIFQIAKDLGKKPLDVVFDLISESDETLYTVYRGHNEKDMQSILRHQTSMIECDSPSFAIDGPLSHYLPHPRAFGTFPLIIRKYVRGDSLPELPEEPGHKLLRLETAINKMSLLPARRLGLQDRGMVKTGMRADIVVFDPDKISDRGTYEKPLAYPDGISYVFVNGKLAIEEGGSTGALAGEVLRKTHPTG